MELILTDFMKSLVEKSFTTEGGIDACVTSTNSGMIRDPYTLKCQKDVTFTTTCVDPIFTSQT